jgi:hypothetical protein
MEANGHGTDVSSVLHDIYHRRVTEEILVGNYAHSQSRAKVTAICEDFYDELVQGTCTQVVNKGRATKANHELESVSALEI